VRDVVDMKVLLRVVTDAISHDFKPVPSNMAARPNVPSSVVTLATFHPLKSASTSTASQKVFLNVVTDVVIQELKPVPLNFDDLNVCSSDVTLATFHPLKSAFIPTAPRKVYLSVVTEVVIHLLMAAPTNVAALGLPSFTRDPPA
jgi:hypothetical protein